MVRHPNTKTLPYNVVESPFNVEIRNVTLRQEYVYIRDKFAPSRTGKNFFENDAVFQH